LATRRAVLAWSMMASLDMTKIFTAVLEWIAIGCLYRNVSNIQPGWHSIYEYGLDRETWQQLRQRPPAEITDW
jgi:hypothetical protein